MVGITSCHTSPSNCSSALRKEEEEKGRRDKDKEEKSFSPHGDGTGVVIPSLAVPAPVVAHQIHVQHVGGHLGFAPLQLLHRPLAHEEGGCACSAKHGD